MTILWLNLAIVYLFSLAARYCSVTSKDSIILKPNKFMVLIATISLVMVSGLRKNMADTYYYMYSYAHTNFTWENIKGKEDIGFNIFQMFLQHLSYNPQFMVFMTAMITNVLIVSVLYKYSGMFEISLYVYITNGLFLTSMNGIREFFAAAIVFAATKYLFDGNWIKYILIILLASFFHKSALILIPIYFIVRRKAWTKSTLVLLFLAVLIVIGYNKFSGILFYVIQDTQYGHYKDFAAQGANVMRVAVEAIPLLFAYLGREKLKALFPKSDYVVNLSVIALVFMIISTQNWIFARFNYYFGLYELILISWIVKLFCVKDQKLIYFSIMLFFLIFCFYEEVITYGGHIYQSDFLKL